MEHRRGVAAHKDDGAVDAEVHPKEYQSHESARSVTTADRVEGALDKGRAEGEVEHAARLLVRRMRLGSLRNGPEVGSNERGSSEMCAAHGTRSKWAGQLRGQCARQ